jgi:hypothetical protein
VKGEHKRTVRLPHGYRATFVFRADPAFFEVAWEPSRPAIKSARAWRKFEAAYLEARDAFLSEAMTMTGQAMAVVTPGTTRELASRRRCIDDGPNAQASVRSRNRRSPSQFWLWR